jgi:ADP-ribosyl-[dinitrogen reductase] hydrolase
MLAGIIGDVIGSVYEAHQWQDKNLPLITTLPFDKQMIKPLVKSLKWVRQDYSWTDDTLCTLALFAAYIKNENPKCMMLHFCNKYKNESIGFGKAFNAWLDNPVPYGSLGNGSIMRLGFIPFLPLNLAEKIKLAMHYTAISHNHPDSFQAVTDYVVLAHLLQSEPSKKDSIIQNVLMKYMYEHSVESLHEQAIFEMNALKTFLQACVILKESHSFEEVLRNSFYVGGDSDTLACIAGNLASLVFEVPQDLLDFSLNTLKPYEDLNELVTQFKNLV